MWALHKKNEKSEERRKQRTQHKRGEEKKYKDKRRGKGASQEKTSAADFTKIYATAQVHLRNIYGATYAINVVQVDLRNCVKFREIGYSEVSINGKTERPRVFSKGLEIRLTLYSFSRCPGTG